MHRSNNRNKQRRENIYCRVVERAILAPVAANLRADCVLVDIFLLNVMKTHESLNCFDNALRVSDQIMVCIRNLKAIGEPS